MAAVLGTAPVRDASFGGAGPLATCRKARRAPPPLQRARYKGFPFRRDFPLQGNSLYKGFPFTKDCIYDSPSGPLRSPPCWLAHSSAQAQGSRESEPIHQMKAQRSAAQRSAEQRSGAERSAAPQRSAATQQRNKNTWEKQTTQTNTQKTDNTKKQIN